MQSGVKKNLFKQRTEIGPSCATPGQDFESRGEGEKALQKGWAKTTVARI